MRHGRVLLYCLNDPSPEVGVPASELVRKRGKDVLEFLSVEVIPRAEEAGTECSILCNHFGECLGDCRLSGPSQAVEPEYVSFLWIFGPPHYAIEDGFSGPVEAPVVVASSMPCVLHRFKLSKPLQVRFLAIISKPRYLRATLRDRLTRRVRIFSFILFVVYSVSSVIRSDPSAASSILSVDWSFLFVVRSVLLAAFSILRVASSILLVVSSILSVVRSVFLVLSLILLVFS